MDIHTLAARIAHALRSHSIRDVTVHDKGEETVVQFNLFETQGTELYYQSVIHLKATADSPYIFHYELRLPHKQKEGNYAKMVADEYKLLLDECGTSSVTDWDVSVNETDSTYAPHVESFYTPESAPSYAELIRYINNIDETFRKLNWDTAIGQTP